MFARRHEQLKAFSFRLSQMSEDASASEAAAQNLKAKLQAALMEGVTLLETVQQLESEKSVLESQVPPYCTV